MAASAKQWYRFDLSTTPRLQAATDYYLALALGGATVRLYGAPGGTNARTATRSYASGPADPFPAATPAGYTPAMYAVIEYEETFTPPVVNTETLTTTATAAPTLPSQPFIPTADLLEVDALVGGDSAALASEVYSSVSGNYVDDLKLNITASPTIASFIELSEEILEVDGSATPLLATELSDYVERVALPAAAAPTLSGETYTSPFAEMLQANIGATFGLDEVFGIFGDDTTIAPDLEVIVPCYTQVVDIALYSEDTDASLYPGEWEVAV